MEVRLEVRIGLLYNIQTKFMVSVNSLYVVRQKPCGCLLSGAPAKARQTTLQGQGSQMTLCMVFGKDWQYGNWHSNLDQSLLR